MTQALYAHMNNKIKKKKEWWGKEFHPKGCLENSTINNPHWCSDPPEIHIQQRLDWCKENHTCLPQKKNNRTFGACGKRKTLSRQKVLWNC
jgi:hypothetical protein